MPGVNRSYSVQSLAPPAMNLAVETVILTLGPFSVTYDGDPINVTGSIAVTAGTAATAVTVRVRRGTTTAGALVSAAEPTTVVAGNQYTLGFDALDSPGAVAGQQYVVTAQQTAATANGPVGYAEATTTVGS